MPSIWPAEVTPPLNDERVQEFARRIKPGSSLVQVKRTSKKRPLGNCYWDVAVTIEEQGGDIVQGWMMLRWPDRYIAAIHHAVWRHPSGRLLDITEPQPPDKGAQHTVFLPDDAQQVRLDIPPHIDNRFQLLSDDTLIRTYLDAYAQRQVVVREISEIAWKFGYRCENNFSTARGINKLIPAKILDDPPGMVSRYTSLLRSHEALSQIIGEEIARMRADDASK